MKEETCSKDHSGEIAKSVGDLPDSQAGFWRHKCAGCAYLLGKAEAEKTMEAQRDQIRKLKERIDALEEQATRR